METTKNLNTGEQKFGKDLSPEISNKITNPVRSFKVLKEAKREPKIKKFNIGILEARVKNKGRRIDVYVKRKTVRGKRRI